MEEWRVQVDRTEKSLGAKNNLYTRMNSKKVSDIIESVPAEDDSEAGKK